jgi:hypothetical protein
VSLSSLVKGLTVLLGGLTPMEEPEPCSIFSNRQHFAVCDVACPLPAFGGSIRPWLYIATLLSLRPVSVSLLQVVSTLVY